MSNAGPSLFNPIGRGAGKAHSRLADVALAARLDPAGDGFQSTRASLREPPCTPARRPYGGERKAQSHFSAWAEKLPVALAASQCRISISHVATGRNRHENPALNHCLFNQ